ncbi:MAG: hypothetical protein IPM29_01790 [Planctomycetes bacterium]|nr:hypothetical protein [Planctomycetota bacterium]
MSHLLPSPRLVAATIALAVPALAQISPPLAVSDLVAQADLVVVASVVARDCRWNEERTTIRTFVTLGDVDVRKGEVEGPIVLRFDGGSVGDDHIVVPCMPRLAVGSRYLLFVAGNGRHVSPIVGFDQGCFAIRDDRLVDAAGRELIGVQDDRLVVAARKHTGPVLPPSSGPAVASVDHTVVPAAPDVEARERELLARQRSRTVAPLAELPRTTARTPAGVPAASPPPIAAPAGAAGSELRDVAPIVVTGDDDGGRRVSLAAFLSTLGLESR